MEIQKLDRDSVFAMLEPTMLKVGQADIDERCEMVNRIQEVFGYKFTIRLETLFWGIAEQEILAAFQLGLQFGANPVAMFELPQAQTQAEAAEKVHAQELETLGV